MTAEELNAIENLTKEIKELRKVLTVFASADIAGIKLKATDSIPSLGIIKTRMRDGMNIINELKNDM